MKSFNTDLILYTREREIDDVYVPKMIAVAWPIERSSQPKTSWNSKLVNMGTGMFVAVLLVSSAGVTYGNLNETGSFMYDAEISPLNRFIASLLDFVGIETPQSYEIEEDGPAVVVPVTVTPEPGSVSIDYRVTTDITGGEIALCNALSVNVTSPPFNYSGGLTSLNDVATDGASLTLSLTLPDAAGISAGDQCLFDLVFRGWNELVTENTGYTDEERISVVITFVEGESPPSDFDVVLNEYLPNPDVEANGLNFGDDNGEKPLGEWVELYNKGNAPIDVLDWYMTDASGGVGNTHAVIGSSNTNTGSTIIPAGGWLVVYMNKPTLNNTGETIRLFTDDDVEVDSTSFTVPPPACFNDPTPGTGNDADPPTGTPGNGNQEDCNDALAPPNKSYARVPDGTGAWVDPIPTPGGPNTLEEFEAAALSIAESDDTESVEDSSGERASRDDRGREDVRDEREQREDETPETPPEDELPSGEPQPEGDYVPTPVEIVAPAEEVAEESEPPLETAAEEPAAEPEPVTASAPEPEPENLE